MPPKYVNVKPIMQFLLQAEKLTFPLPTSQSYCLGPSTASPQLVYFIPYVLVTEDSCKSKAEHDYTVWFMSELSLATLGQGLQELISNEHPGLISLMDWLDLLAVQGTLKSLLQHHSSKASVLQCSAFFIVQLTSVHDYWKNHSFD